MNRTKESGVTLLLAFIIITIAFSLGSGIYTLLFSEYRLAGRETRSVEAFYAADAGFECAKYYDVPRDYNNNNVANDPNDYRFPNPGTTEPSPQPVQIDCGVSSPLTSSNVTSTVIPGAPPTKKYEFSITLDNNTCAFVTVYKVDNGATVATTIESRGRSPATQNCAASENTVERALTITTHEADPT